MPTPRNLVNLYIKVETLRALDGVAQLRISRLPSTIADANAHYKPLLINWPHLRALITVHMYGFFSEDTANVPIDIDSLMSIIIRRVEDIVNADPALLELITGGTPFSVSPPQS